MTGCSSWLGSVLAQTMRNVNANSRNANALANIASLTNLVFTVHLLQKERLAGEGFDSTSNGTSM